MCDYSLEHVKSRPARQGDRLTTHDFERGSNGFRATSDHRPGIEAAAVCLQPGTELTFNSRVVAYDYMTTGEVTVNGETRVFCQPGAWTRQATFVQVNKNRTERHHDALLFADGAVVLLSDLYPDQHAVVLSLPAGAEAPERASVEA